MRRDSTNRLNPSCSLVANSEQLGPHGQDFARLPVTPRPTGSGQGSLTLGRNCLAAEHEQSLGVMANDLAADCQFVTTTPRPCKVPRKVVTHEDIAATVDKEQRGVIRHEFSDHPSRATEPRRR